MNCVHCNKCITDIANTITCDICNHHLNVTCLNKYILTTHPWNSTKPSKISVLNYYILIYSYFSVRTVKTIHMLIIQIDLIQIYTQKSMIVSSINLINYK